MLGYELDEMEDAPDFETLFKRRLQRFTSKYPNDKELGEAIRRYERIGNDSKEGV